MDEKMNKEEKETIKIVKSGKNTFDILGIPGTSSYENLKGALKEVSNYIKELQKELEEKTTILMAGADKVKQLEKENEKLKEKLHEKNERIIELNKLLEDKE